MKTLSPLLLGPLMLAATVQAQQPQAQQPQAQQFQASAPANIAQTVATCAGCHGQQGEGNAANNYPRLAGQSQAYLAKQLHAYADGSRNNAIMMPIAKGLSAEQIETVSAYYAKTQAPPSKATAPTGNDAKRGAQLANVGDNKIAVQACANCHGPGGIGEFPTYPYLAGQHAGYLVSALNEWKSGARKTDPSQQMTIIAKRLSDGDIAALGAWFAAQPAPPPEPQRTNLPAGTPQRPVAPSSGDSGTPSATPTTGGGVEQGAPTSGGAQGIGGGGAASGSGPSGSGAGSNQQENK